MSDYTRMYPGPTRKILFDGGLNSKFSNNLIADNDSADCLNVMYDGKAVATRHGSMPFNTAAVGSFVCDGLFTRVDFDGNEQMVAFFGGSGYRASGTSWITIPSAQSIYTNGTRVSSFQDEGYLFVNNGTQPYKYDGTNFTRHGIDVPPSAPVCVSNGASVLSGSYAYKVAFFNSALVLGDVGPVSNHYNAVSAVLSIDLPVAPQSYGVAGRAVYRTEASGLVYKLVTMVANNTATVYNDNKPDTSLGALAPTDQGKPPKWKTAIFHPTVGRAFFNDVDNPSYVKYTEALNPFVVKAANFEKMGDKGGDTPNGFGLMENGIIVTCDRRPYLMYFPDNDPTNWIKAISRSQYGNVCSDAIVDYNGGILCPATEYGNIVGFQNLVNDSTDPSVARLTYNSVSSDMISDKIEPDIFQIPKAYIKNISAITHKNKVYIALPFGESATYNNRIYVLDFSYKNTEGENANILSVWAGVTQYPWFPWDSLYINNFTVYQGKLYGGNSSGDGFVYQLNTDNYSDINSTGEHAINSYYTTKEFFGSMEDAERHKDFRYIYFLADCYDDMFMGFSAKSDSDMGIYYYNHIDIDTTRTYWGYFIWGFDILSAGYSQRDINFDVGNLNGKRVQFKFSNLNRVGYHFKIHYMSFEYNIKGRR